jgi:hypothetical protein
MAEDNDEHSTPNLLSLNQAVALIVARLPPHDTDAVQTAMRNALVDGRLRDCCVLGDDFDQSGSTDPDTWRRWFEEDRVNWRTGEVYFPPRPSHRDNLKVLKPPSIRSQFRRQDVFAFFGITEAPPTPPAERKAPQAARVKRALLELYPPDGRPPEDVSTEEIRGEVAAKLAPENRQRGLAEPSWDTIKRVIESGRKA